MRELDSVLAAWETAANRGQRSILATVVDVSGSSYRRPGARMLVIGDGASIGCISGGCLESDVIKRAWWWTEGGKPILRTYDTTSYDDAVFEFGLGCNGIIRVLLERLEGPSAALLQRFLSDCKRSRQVGVMATVISVSGNSPSQIGDRLYIFPDLSIAGSLGDSKLEEDLHYEMETVRCTRKSHILRIARDSGLVEVFVEAILPAVSLLVFGAGHDALPVVRIAHELGWHITVFDGRPAHATSQRFPQADQVILTTAADPLGGFTIDPHAAAILMNHNVTADRAVLRRMFAEPPRYAGVLGPRQRAEKMLAALGIDKEPGWLHAPAGLDIGADSPDAIALAIIAEVQAAFSGREGAMLRSRLGPIYEMDEAQTPRTIHA